MKRRRKDTVDRLAKIARRPGGELLESDGRYARITGIRYESKVPGEPGRLDPSIVIEADI